MELKQLKIKESLRWLWRASCGVKARIAVACVLGLARVCAGLCFIWISKTLIDVATGSGGSAADDMLALFVTLVTLMLVELACSLTVGYLTTQTEIRLKNSLRSWLYTSLMHGDKGDGKRWHSGDLLNRLTEDVRVVTATCCASVPEFIVMLVQLAAAFALLWQMAPTLALCIIGIMPLCLILSKVYIRRMRRLTATIRESDSRIQSNMQEGLQHRIVAQTLECVPYMQGRLDGLQSQLYGQTMSRTRFSVFSRGLVRIGFIAGYLTAFGWSVWHLHSGAITFGMMTAFLQLVARIQNPIANLSSYIPAFVHTITSVDRLSELEAPLNPPLRGEEVPAGLFLSPLRGGVGGGLGLRLIDVSFRYSPDDRLIFDNFSYDFAPGTKTAVMGETGVGKSTLFKLILALLQPGHGRIEIYDNRHSETISAATRSQLVYVPQGNSLLDGTIRENLLLGNPEATEEQLWEALHTAAADFVSQLPNALDTRCGELGGGLSEGQAQRIAIARALLRNGSILLLDEFNSALDAETAETLLKRLIAARPDSTIIFISHQEKVTEYCDNILKLK